MAELKPCPFCGGDATLKKESVCIGHGDNDTMFYVKCHTCGGRSNGFGSLNAESVEGRMTLAILFWEMRAEDGK